MDATNTPAFVFDDIRHVADEIAQENKFINYKIDAKDQPFTGDNYASKIVKVRIIEDEGGDGKEINMLVKMANMSKELRNMFPSNLYATEFHAYMDFFPVLSEYEAENNVPELKRFVYPIFYKGSTELYKEYLFIKDISYEGYKMYGRRNILDYKHAKVIMEQLARYNAISFAMKHKDPERFQEFTKDLQNKFMFKEEMKGIMKGLMGRVLSAIPSEDKRQIISDFLDEQTDAFEKHMDSSRSEPYNVIAHGDFHINNMLFNYEGDDIKVVFVDWQLLRYAAPTTDIIRIIYLTTDKTFRDKYLKELVQFYHDTLKESLSFYGCDVNEVYPKEVMDKAMLDGLACGIINGVIGGAFLLANPGEEIELEEMFSESSALNITAGDELLRRLDGLIEDIEFYKTLNLD